MTSNVLYKSYTMLQCKWFTLAFWTPFKMWSCTLLGWSIITKNKQTNKKPLETKQIIQRTANKTNGIIWRNVREKKKLKSFLYHYRLNGQDVKKEKKKKRRIKNGKVHKKGISNANKSKSMCGIRISSQPTILWRKPEENSNLSQWSSYRQDGSSSGTF